MRSRRSRERRRRGVGGYPEELVADAPGQKGRRRVFTRVQHPVAAGSMKRRVFVERVNQDIGVENPHSIAVHQPVKLLAAGNVYPEPAAPPDRQSRQRVLPPARSLRLGEYTPETRLHEGGHRGSAPRRFFPQPPHHTLFDIERRLHMENHINGFPAGQTGRATDPPGAPTRRASNGGEPPRSSSATTSASTGSAPPGVRRGGRGDGLGPGDGRVGLPARLTSADSRPSHPGDGRGGSEEKARSGGGAASGRCCFRPTGGGPGDGPPPACRGRLPASYFMGVQVPSSPTPLKV